MPRVDLNSSCLEFNMVKFNNDWDIVLKDIIEGENYQNIRNFLISEYQNYTIYPDKNDIFNAFKNTSYQDTNVVIIGQDPYHEEGQAHGLAFSVKENVKFPPSLRNIFIEIKNEFGYEIPKSGDLTGWARQGVLLLNATLTVRKGLANSHCECGWRDFTDDVIKKLNEKKEPIIFVLWGSYARSKKSLIDTNFHYVLEAAHPSPLSAYNGFMGCGHFKEINRILKAQGKREINWEL